LALTGVLVVLGCAKSEKTLQENRHKT